MGLTKVQPGVSDDQGGAGVIGADCKNNAGTPNTQFDLSAKIAVLKKANGGTYAAYNTGTITNNLATAGPAANGRDQAGAFSNDSFVHFFFIWNGTLLRTLSSASLTPTLPGGYTHHVYVGTARIDGSGNLLKQHIKGNRVFYEEIQSVLNNGNQVAETAIDTSDVVPSNALLVSAFVSALVDTDGTGAASANLALRLVSGNTFAGIYSACLIANFTAGDQLQLDFPNVAQNLFYEWTVSVGTPADQRLSLYVQGYSIPNGG